MQLPETLPPYPSQYASHIETGTALWVCAAPSSLLDDLYAKHVEDLDREGWDVEQTPHTEIDEHNGTMRFIHTLVRRGGSQ